MRTSPVPSDVPAATPTTTMNGYPGSKSGSGVAERIIRQMPPHSVYVEAFAGSAAVFRRKLPAASSILMDVDAKCCHRLRSFLAGRGDVGRAEVLQGDALDLLPLLPAVQASDTLVYLDPPYLKSVRTHGVLYDFEFGTPAEHKALLEMAMRLPCLVMISGYRSALYEKILKRWYVVEIPTMTRGGRRTECLWRNFEEPAILHDSRWAGETYRERERIKRKQQRWSAKFVKMDGRERQAIAAALVEVDRATVDAAMRSAPERRNS
jgi:DNA adenine methylase